ncbi:MAG: biotin/lipoyl-binding protein, partial [Gammaproteobacteria bacterium]
MTWLCFVGLNLMACDGEEPGANRARGTPSTGSRGGFSRGPTLVVTRAAEIRTIIEVVEAIGTTLANESVTITAKVTDTISRVNFEDGEHVKTGDVLVELANEEETALLAEAKANVDDANTQYRRL